MQAIKILEMEPGEELDKLVSEAIGDAYDDPALGRLYRHLKDLPSGGWKAPLEFSLDISAAWQLVEWVKKEAFSTRDAFLRWLEAESLQLVEGTGELVTVPWPNAFFYVTPETICKALILVKNPECQKIDS